MLPPLSIKEGGFFLGNDPQIKTGVMHEKKSFRTKETLVAKVFQGNLLSSAFKFLFSLPWCWNNSNPYFERLPKIRCQNATERI